MRAWIEPNDDLAPILSIDILQDGILIESINWLYRPLAWTIENIENGLQP
jgi:hypothetical protein